MKVLVLGAGAMGCLYGAALHRAGAETVLVDVNQDYLDAINRDGLEVDTRAGVERLTVPALRPAAVTDQADLVLVFTKTFQTEAALRGIAGAIGPHTHLLSLQNGLGSDTRLSQHVDGKRVMVGISTLPADLVGPGRVRNHGEGTAKLYPAFADGDIGFAGNVASLLTQGGLQAALDSEIQAAIWSKAVFNAAMNPLCTLTRRTPGFLAQQESRALIRSVVEEGVAAAGASGVTIDAEAILDLTEMGMRDHADHEPSMLQDVKAGRNTEIDAINGAIVGAARAAGLSVPVTETLWRLVKLEDAKLPVTTESRRNG